ncbi:MAG: hypothetical protein ACOYBY_18910, partial [Dermatophilaceae bacterium]
RSKRVYVTAAGATIITALDAAMADVDRAFLAPLSEEQRNALHEMLRLIAARLSPDNNDTAAPGTSPLR